MDGLPEDEAVDLTAEQTAEIDAVPSAKDLEAEQLGVAPIELEHEAVVDALRNSE